MSADSGIRHLLRPAAAPHPAQTQRPGRTPASVRRIGAFLTTHRGAREVALVAALYAAYSMSRTLASSEVTPALARASRIINVEQLWNIDVEPWLNTVFVDHAWLGVLGAFWYASAHYVVTLAVVVWLFWRHPGRYVTARYALVIATLIALAFYLSAPTAPPRFSLGYIDVLALHSDVGWWGAEASAPKGLGNLTNELAAFPSMHAGWALWVALVVRSTLRHRWARIAIFGYPLITGIVVIGTGNHWTLDVLIGFAITTAAWWVAMTLGRRSPAGSPAASGL